MSYIKIENGDLLLRRCVLLTHGRREARQGTSIDVTLYVRNDRFAILSEASDLRFLKLHARREDTVVRHVLEGHLVHTHLVGVYADRRSTTRNITIR